MDNLQELKFRFSDDTTYRYIDSTIENIEELIEDFNYNKTNKLFSSKFFNPAKGRLPMPLKPIFPIIEHTIRSIEDAFKDAISGPYSPIPYANTIKPEQYKRIQSEQPLVYTRTIKHNQLKTKENILHLGTHTRCVCSETGISFAVALPSPLDTSMSLLHPFAFHSNVQTFIRNYQKHGIPLAQLDSQALAGMLITILKHKNFTVCRDYVAANTRLRQINKKTLTWCLAYFHRLQTRDIQPQINLLADGNPTTQLIGFVKICKGEDTTVQALHVMEKRQAPIKAKVYQTESDKEAAILKSDLKALYTIIERLEKANPHVSHETIIQFENRFSKLAVLNDFAKAQLIADLVGYFGENTDTKAIETIIRSNDMTATQKELLSFTMELEKEIKEFQTEKPIGKIDFKALMAKKA